MACRQDVTRATSDGVVADSRRSSACRGRETAHRRYLRGGCQELRCIGEETRPLADIRPNIPWDPRSSRHTVGSRCVKSYGSVRAYRDNASFKRRVGAYGTMRGGDLTRHHLENNYRGRYDVVPCVHCVHRCVRGGSTRPISSRWRDCLCRHRLPAFCPTEQRLERFAQAWCGDQYNPADPEVDKFIHGTPSSSLN